MVVFDQFSSYSVSIHKQLYSKVYSHECWHAYRVDERWHYALNCPAVALMKMVEAMR